MNFSHNEIEEKNDPNCRECLGCGTVFVYFVNHKRKEVIEEWVYCIICYPTSCCHQFDRSCDLAEEISSEEAHRLIEKEGYTKYVP
ncbi:hypothetical protein K9M47_01870 [Candidatus Gracilibacteria bacterium]|nr:hypothetical protein [Candidatus Gracilibacteria bacterium]MCF7898397.1 hypothetical protein [Candidatus Paceibacterota bacterium]